jgi:hypothetical protein
MTRIRILLALTIVGLTFIACGGGTASTGDSACPPVQVSGPDGQPLDLSGEWSGNDGGLYYMKQLGSCLWWSGLSNFVDQGQYPGQDWIMTFRGTINGDGVITGDFVDVKSNNPGSGTITIEARIDQVNGQGVVQLYRTAATGHEIGVTFWQRAPAAPTTGPTEPPVQPTSSQEPVDTTVPTAAPS